MKLNQDTHTKTCLNDLNLSTFYPLQSRSYECGQVKEIIYDEMCIVIVDVRVLWEPHAYPSGWDCCYTHV